MMNWELSFHDGVTRILPLGSFTSGTWLKEKSISGQYIGTILPMVDAEVNDDSHEMCARQSQRMSVTCPTPRLAAWPLTKRLERSNREYDTALENPRHG